MSEEQFPTVQRRDEEQERVGIAREFTVSKVCYNPESQSIVLLCRSGNASRYLGTLFRRTLRDRKYERLPGFSDGSFVSSVEASITRPECFVNVHTFCEGQGKWEGLYLLPLPSGPLRRLAGAQDVVLPRPYTQVTVFDIVAIKADTSTLICTACLIEDKPQEVGEFLVPIGGYFLVEFGVIDKSIQLISKIEPPLR